MPNGPGNNLHKKSLTSPPKPPSHKLYIISHIPNWWLVGVLVWWPILFWAYPAYLPYPFKWRKIPSPKEKKTPNSLRHVFTINDPHSQPIVFSSSRSIQVWLTCMGVLDLLGSSCLQYLRASFQKSKHTKKNSGRCEGVW